MNLDQFLDQLSSKIQETAQRGYVSGEFSSNGIDLRARAPNAIEWVTGKQYLNIPNIFQHVRQYQLIRDFFQLRCPVCNTGSSDCWNKEPEEIQAEHLLVWNPRLDDDWCPSCDMTRTDFLDEGLLSAYETMIGVAGMRSGKSVMAACIGTYIRHVLITMGITERGFLHRLFQILPTQNLEIAFVATTQTQSNQTIWANFQNQCALSPWFNAYRMWVKKKEAQQVLPKGIKPWVYKELEDSITDDYVGLNCFSLNSNSSGMAGRTRAAFFIDELSRFGLGDSKLGADEVWAVFERSLMTIRGAKRALALRDRWLGTAVAVSSPISIEDKTMLLYGASSRIKSMHAWKYATWEFNPTLPKSLFDEQYELDPIGTERDYGANPPNAASPLVQDPLRFWSSIDNTAEPSARFELVDQKDKSDRDYAGAKLTWSRTDHREPLYLFADAGVAFDQFALTACSGVWLPGLTQADQVEIKQVREMAHRGVFQANNPHLAGGVYMMPGGRAANDDEPVLTLVTYHEWSIRILPAKNKPVWFESIVDIVRELMKFRKVAMFASDHWNSESTLQTISNMGVPTQKVRLAVEDWTRMVQDAVLGRLRMLPPLDSDELSLDERGSLKMGKKPTEMSSQGVTLYELFKLERSENLKRVFNPKKGLVPGHDSDDLASCLTGAHRLVQESAGKTEKNERERARAKETSAGATFFGGLARSRRWT